MTETQGANEPVVIRASPSTLAEPVRRRIEIPGLVDDAPRGIGFLLAMQNRSVAGNMYQGTVPREVVAARRKTAKAAKAQRKRNRDK